VQGYTGGKKKKKKLEFVVNFVLKVFDIANPSEGWAVEKIGTNSHCKLSNKVVWVGRSQGKVTILEEKRLL
jgi:hypothetical protein